MSVVCASSEGWVLNHFEFISNLYTDVNSTNSEESTSYSYDTNLFKIITPFLFTSQSKKSTLKTTTSTSGQPEKVQYSSCEVSLT